MVKTRKKLLIIHSSDELYGSDRILLEVAEALKDDWNLEVWLPVDHQDGEQRLFNELRRRQVAVIHIDMPILRRSLMNPKGLTRFAGLFPGMVRRMRAAHADHVYLMTAACLLFAPLARLAGVPHVTAHLQEPWGTREAFILRKLSFFADHRLAISQTVASSTGLRSDSVSIVHNAVPRLAGSPNPEAALIEGFEQPLYLIASRWNGHKGHETLLRAWETAGHPGKLFILGSAPQGNDSVDVPDLVRRHVSDPNSVQIVGQVESPEAWFDAVDCMILPTDTIEGCGLVVIEAFRHGKAAIVSDSGGPAEVVSHKENGLIFTPKDVAGLARLMKTTTKAELQAMGAQGRRCYERNYTPERFHQAIRAEVSRLDPVV
ncbi:glycosyltransferase family 4 protein [Paeniglutamicibacter antarcticus]|uniref:Glycosyltransferase family 4 protein n=1 Tax=Paeniglutamicibacter antarcticus TaxID=494023 RepID=A0ABP9TLS3_9MICC